MLACVVVMEDHGVSAAQIFAALIWVLAYFGTWIARLGIDIIIIIQSCIEFSLTIDHSCVPTVIGVLWFGRGRDHSNKGCEL